MSSRKGGALQGGKDNQSNKQLGRVAIRTDRCIGDSRYIFAEPMRMVEHILLFLEAFIQTEVASLKYYTLVPAVKQTK